MITDWPVEAAAAGIVALQVHRVQGAGRVCFDLRKSDDDLMRLFHKVVCSHLIRFETSVGMMNKTIYFCASPLLSIFAHHDNSNNSDCWKTRR